MQCPDVQELEAYLAQALPDEDTATIGQHVDGCAACRERLAEISDNHCLEPLVRRLLKRSAAAQPAGVVADRSGGYSVVRELGRGGMGVVFEAEQHNPHRRVALKLLNLSTADRYHERLFDRECRALARVRHPSIAAVYEAGRTHDGRPFVAMELVEGQSLTAYARQRKLCLNERLELFAKVCETVAYAHGRGVIHRDLKPSNILVEADGTPKVLDFGLARIVAEDGSGDSSDNSLVTEPGRVFGTVPYMSPEHLRGDSHDVDVRSDVYSLGVVLYELLLDRMPYAPPAHAGPGGGWSNLAEAARIICELAPAPPRAVRHDFPRDVETILLKALAKDPQRRYQSAADLAGDIRHYLRREPIVARPASAWYVFSRFARRNRALVTGAAVAVVAVLGGATVATVQAQIATRERDAAERRLAYAQQAANYVFAGVGSSMAYVIGTGDAQRHLAEEAYVFYKRLADEAPNDLFVQARLWATLRRLALHALDLGNQERVDVLLALLQERMAAAPPDDSTVLQETMQLEMTRAHIAGRRGDTLALIAHARNAAVLRDELAARYDAAERVSGGPPYAIAQHGPQPGEVPPRVALLGGWAVNFAETYSEMLVDADPALAAEQLATALTLVNEMELVDPAIETTYREDASEYAPLAAPIRLRMPARPHYHRARAYIECGLARLAAMAGNLAVPDAASRQMDSTGAAVRFHSAIELADELYAASHSQPSVIMLFASAHHHLARWLLESGDPAGAQSHLNRAVAAHRRLAEADPPVLRWQEAVNRDVSLLESARRRAPTTEP